jgi:hypothetical protein
MITRVGEFNTKGVTGGLRQSTQSMTFTHSCTAPVKDEYVQNGPQKDKQPPTKSPIWTGTSIVLGSVLFMIAYFLISGSKRA